MPLKGDGPERGEADAGLEPRMNQLSKASEKPAFLIVGIGASAGGLAAFKSFFAKVPADIGMAFVLVQHLSPDHKSMLVELLRPHTSIPIVEAHDGIEVEKNHVYVIPPDATLRVEDMLLRVAVPAPPRTHRRPIDTFFSSLAETHTDCAVAIVLSGVGSDGSLYGRQTGRL
jgi:two-component system CheB/CheR fusion protein